MKVVTIELLGKKVVLLNGARAEKPAGKAVKIEAPDQLRRNPDAVAFGYMSGRWMAAA